MKTLVELTDIELIQGIKRCDLEIIKLLTQSSVDHYPGAIMGLGDFYIEKSLFLNELLRRKCCDL